MNHSVRHIRHAGRSFTITPKLSLHGMQEYHIKVDGRYIGYALTISTTIQRIRGIENELRDRSATDYLIEQAIAQGQIIGD